MNRRAFLRGSAAALGAVTLAGRAVTAAWAAQGDPHIALVGDTSGGGLYHPHPSGLTRTPLLKLPSGSVRASGWLAQQLSLETTGIAGAYDQVSHFLDTSATGWLHPSQSAWEEVPYWLRGLASLAGVSGDPGLRSKTTTWVDGILATGQPDGFFGPAALRTSLGGGPDFWPYMPLLQALCTYQEWSGDSRVVPFLTKFFTYQNGFGASVFNQSWGASRWATTLASVHWLFARTGDRTLLSLADRIHQYGGNYVNNLPVRHNVSLAQGFTEPAFAALRGDASLTQAAYQNYATIQNTWGQFPGGGFAGDENVRTGYGDPRQGFETCGIVEYMQSFESMARLTGDAGWAEGTETLAFNSLPAAMEPRHTALHYATAANQIQLDDYDKTLGQFDNSFSMQAYLLGVDKYRCCPHNYGQGWPYFTENTWLATADNGLAAMLYAPTTVTARVGTGTALTITETTAYPFDEAVTLTLSLSGSAAFPLYLRIPSWCDSPSVRVNGAAVQAPAGPGFVAVNRTWSGGDTVTAAFPMPVRTRTWAANHDAVSVSRGPLTYALRIGQNFLRHNDASSHWAEYQVLPTSAWNYGLVPGTLTATRTGASGNPFTQEGTPVAITSQARAIPNWQGDTQDVVTTLQPSPVSSGEPTETVTLVPMGAAALRVSAFPVIGTGAAWDWQLPATPSASWCWSGDTVNALNSACVPVGSGDRTHPRFTWWDHTGSTEWVQYTYSSPVTASGVSVYWYDDTGSGQCRPPASWHAEYLDGTSWRQVAGASGYGTSVDTFNRAAFTPVTTTAVRIVAQLRPGCSGGILQWTVQAARAAVHPGTWYRVQNKNSGKVLGVSGMSTADSANVVQYTDNASADHLWQFTALGNNRFTVQNRNSGLLLAVDNASRANSAAVQQFHDNGTADHQWHIVDNGDGWYRVRNGNSGLVLGVSGMSTADSAQVVQYEDNRTADHLWRFL